MSTTNTSGYVTEALKTGKLKKGPCEICGTRRRVQAHHEDYSKPLKVRWLCIKHHHAEHKRLRRLGLSPLPGKNKMVNIALPSGLYQNIVDAAKCNERSVAITLKLLVLAGFEYFKTSNCIGHATWENNA